MKPFYERDGITIYCGDCLEVMPRLTAPVDAIIADLPYGTTACEWDSIIPLESLWTNYKRLIKQAGAIVLFGSQPFTSLLVMSNYEWFKWEDVWDKCSPVGHLNCKVMPLRKHENILTFGQGRITYNPQMKKGIMKRKGGYGHLDKKHVYGTHGENKPTYINDDYYPTSIIEISGVNKNLHPTQKPVALMSYLIRTYTNPGELILDNTMGSGTTLVAAQNEGRRAIGIETNEDYCRIAVDRLRQPSFFSIPIQPAAKVEAEQAVMAL